MTVFGGTLNYSYRRPLTWTLGSVQQIWCDTVADLPTTGAAQNDQAFVYTPPSMYTHNGTTWVLTASYGWGSGGGGAGPGTCNIDCGSASAPDTLFSYNGGGA